MSIFGFVFLDLPTILLGIVLLPFFVSHLIRAAFKINIPSSVVNIFAFWAGLAGLIADFLWINYVVDHLYHEWDRIFIWVPFSYLYHESPSFDSGVLDKTVMWLAPGWTLQSLNYLWMAMVAGCILLAYVSTLICFFKDQKKLRSYGKNLLIVAIGFLLICFGVNLLMGKYALFLLNPVFLLGFLQSS